MTSHDNLGEAISGEAFDFVDDLPNTFLKIEGIKGTADVQDNLLPAVQAAVEDFLFDVQELLPAVQQDPPLPGDKDFPAEGLIFGNAGGDNFGNAGGDNFGQDILDLLGEDPGALFGQGSGDRLSKNPPGDELLPAVQLDEGFPVDDLLLF